MFIREAGRLGPNAFDRFAAALDPLREGAIVFPPGRMDAGEIRRQDPALLLFTLYTAVIDRSPRRASLSSFMGADDARSSLKRREEEVVAFVARPSVRRTTDPVPRGAGPAALPGAPRGPTGEAVGEARPARAERRSTMTTRTPGQTPGETLDP